MDQYASIYWERNKPFAYNFLKIQLYLSRFSREADQREYTYINMYLYKHMEISREMYYKELAQRITESEKSQDLSWQTRPRSGESAWCSSSPSPKCWDQKSRWCKFQAESWKAQDPRRDSSSVQRHGNIDIPAQGNQAERIPSYSREPFCLCVRACSVMSTSLRPHTGLQLIGWQPP